MVSLHDYGGREQTYVKHVFLAKYLETLIHKTASVYSHIAYVDGFAGPWQSSNERLEDTSFGIALNALRRAKGSWKEKHRDVQMSAFLVEREPSAYQSLSRIPARFPDIVVKTYNDNFLSVLPEILKSISRDSFAFFFIDPTGWRIPLRELRALLARPNSEVVFNFMFDFINRAASMREPEIIRGLDELIPYGDWRGKLDEAVSSGEVSPDARKAILVEAFGQSLKQLGKVDYVAETTVLRREIDRTHYCLFYATRHPKGIEVFRDCQVATLREESKTRATTKVRHGSTATGQGEFFESLHDMAPDKLESVFEEHRTEAEKSLLELAPKVPHFLRYDSLRAQVLARHIVRAPDVNKTAARLYRENRLLFPDWEKEKRVPQPNYRTQRP